MICVPSVSAGGVDKIPLDNMQHLDWLMTSATSVHQRTTNKKAKGVWESKRIIQQQTTVEESPRMSIYGFLDLTVNSSGPQHLEGAINGIMNALTII
ncbi:hypothetical protein NPIL_683861 [Nephila pilipes]|uniref:Uncharacterized protein n=1 Tax=Nephila pilipes TaxID=299642 RepID=A0A8X6N0M2_NEPPI|nr:hypothetical protein NPIL_683861 [Nephila pilipes]